MINGANIKLSLTDDSIETDIPEVTPSASPIYGNAATIVKTKSDSRQKLTHLEQDYWLLDGSFIFPDNAQASSYNVGYESPNISDANGNIDTSITFTFSQPHKMLRLRLEFTEETIAVNFNVTIKDNSNTILAHIDVKDNSDVEYIIDKYVENAAVIVLAITKINHAYQRARVYDVKFNATSIFNEDMLVSVFVDNHTSFIADNFDYGTCEFTLFDNGIFTSKDILNIKESGLNAANIIVYIKDNDVYNEFGHYFLNDVVIDDINKEIKITGYDILYKINESIYNDKIETTKDNSYNKIGDIDKKYNDPRKFDDIIAGIAADCDISDYMGAINISTGIWIKRDIYTYGYLSQTTHREALRMSAEAANYYIYVSNDGKIQISAKTESTQTQINSDKIVSISYEVSEQIDGVQVNQYEYFMNVGINYGNFLQDIQTGNAVTLVTKQKCVVEANKVNKFVLDYDDPPANYNLLIIIPNRDPYTEKDADGNNVIKYMSTDNIMICDKDGNEVENSATDAMYDRSSNGCTIYVKTTDSKNGLFSFYIYGYKYDIQTETFTSGATNGNNIKTIDNGLISKKRTSIGSAFGVSAQDIANYQYYHTHNKMKYTVEVSPEYNWNIAKTVYISYNGNSVRTFIEDISISISADNVTQTIGAIEL